MELQMQVPKYQDNETVFLSFQVDLPRQDATPHTPYCEYLSES